MHYVSCKKDNGGKTCDVYKCPCGQEIFAPLTILARMDYIATCECGRIWNIPGVNSPFDGPVELSIEAGEAGRGHNGQ